MKDKTPTIKVVASGLSTDEACEIIAKSVDRRCDFDCKYDDPFVEEVLKLSDAVYRDQITKMTADIIGVITKHADLGSSPKVN